MKRLDLPIEMSDGETIHKEILEVIRSNPIEDLKIITVDDKSKNIIEKKRKRKRTGHDSSERPEKRAR